MAVIREAVNLSKHQMAVAFSGGKDSTVLLHLMTRHLPGVATLGDLCEHRD